MQSSENSYRLRPTFSGTNRNTAQRLAQSLQISHEVVNVGIGVSTQQFDMSVHWRVNFVLNVAGRPRSIRTVGINESDRELIEIVQSASNGLTGSKRYRDFRFRVFGKQHLLFEFETLVMRCNASKIASRRVASRASSGTIEVALASFCVSSLQIGGVYSFPCAFLGSGIISLSVDKGH